MSGPTNASTIASFDPEHPDPVVVHDLNGSNPEVKPLTSPTDLKPIIVGGNAIPQDHHLSTESHPIPINSNPHPAIAATLTNDLNADGPERDWSISPPPPLSSAYDYWYAHGCLPQAARNPASVSGSGSSGATSPEISNALELTPGQIPRTTTTFVDSPTTYYHPPPPPLGSSLTSSAYSSYDAHGEGAASNANSTNGVRTSFPLATATFPTAAEYQHHPGAAPSHHHHHPPPLPPPPHQHPQHSHHGRSHSHSYSMGGGSIGAGSGGYTRLGYQSATTSPHISHAHLHSAPPSAHGHPAVANGQTHPHGAHGLPTNQAQAQARHHSYSAESYEASPTSGTAPGGAAATTASYAANTSNGARSIAGVGYHPAASGPSSSSPTDRFPSSSTYHTPHHSHSHSGSFSMTRVPTTAPREATDSRPVTRHGSMNSAAPPPQYPMSTVYTSHPHAATATSMPYGVPVEMSHPQAAAGYGESPIQRHSMPVSGHNSPRMGGGGTNQQSPSLVLPPIRYAEGEVGHTGLPQQQQQQQPQQSYAMMGMGHFSAPGTPWERVNVSDARALPPQGHGMTR